MFPVPPDFACDPDTVAAGLFFLGHIGLWVGIIIGRMWPRKGKDV